MVFFKRLFRRREKPSVEHPHGVAPRETQAKQDAVREDMEAELAEDRERRSEINLCPDGEQPPAQDSA